MYTHICTRMLPTALAGGAARRTAAQADGGRACRGAAHEGYSRGTQTSVLKPGYSNKGTHSSGETPPAACGRIRRIDGGQCAAVLCTLGVWQYVSGTHGVLKPGCSNKGTQKGTHSSGETPWALAAVFVGNWWAVLGSVVHTRSMACRSHRRRQFSDARACSDRKGTHGVRTRY